MQPTDRRHRRGRARAGLRLALAALLLTGASALALPRSPTADAATTGSFVFGTGGDHSSFSQAATVFQRVGADHPDFFLSLGDLSYDAITPSQWCSFVKDNLNRGAGRPLGDAYGASFPFQLTEGNHEQANYDQYLPCLPDRLGSTVRPGSSYGRDYYVDYPQAAPLARFIVTGPGIEYTMTTGSAPYTWLSDVIDQARASGIRWVIVANHKNYVTAGDKPDEIGSAYFNLLVQKKVDLVLQGHEHDYQRSHQLGLSAACPAVAKGTALPACIVASGSSGSYVAGRGTVLMITGLAGQTARTIAPSDGEAPYFATLEGNAAAPTFGYNRVTVTADRLSSTFVNSSSTGFADTFTIDRGTQPPTTVTRTFGATADTTVKQATPTTAFGSAATVKLDGSPVEQGLLKYTVSGTTGYSVTAAKLRLYVTNGGGSGGRLYRTASTGWSESGVTWNTAPTADATPFASLAATTAGSWVEVDASSVVRGDGTYSFRATSTASDGTEFASKEAATNPSQLVLTLTPTVPAGGTLTLTPVADATIKQDTPTSGYGFAGDLKADTSPVEEALLKFTVTGTGGRPVTSARLRLYVSNPSASGGSVFPVAATDWAEGTVTWATAPPAGAVALGTLGTATLGQWVELDVSSLVTQEGTYSLRIRGGATDGAAYHAREATNRPQLVVTY
jgi:hypothetical protein